MLGQEVQAALPEICHVGDLRKRVPFIFVKQILDRLAQALEGLENGIGRLQAASSAG
jgi:hypothetical protein